MTSDWEILVNTDNGHFKFWAVNFTPQNPRVRWGRIGTMGQEKVFSYDVVVSRRMEKEYEGYRVPTDAEMEAYFNRGVIVLWEI